MANNTERALRAAESLSLDPLAEAYAGGAVFAAFDLETSGLDPYGDRIVEIGGVKFDKRGIIARFSALVNPGIPMPAGAEKVNGINDAMLAGKPGIAEVMPDFLYFVKGAVLMAHNASFDSGFISANLSRLKAEGRAETDALSNPIADTIALAKERFPGQRSYSLQNLAGDLGLSSLDAHRAFDDARLCMEIFLKCIEAADR